MRSRGKQRQRQRLKRRSAGQVVALDPFRRMRFEADFRKAMFAYKDQRLNADTLKRMRRKAYKVFKRYARSAKLAASIKIEVRAKPTDSHTVQILYEKDGNPISPNRLYDALCPGAKRVIGWRMMADGSRVPVSNIDELAELERQRLADELGVGQSEPEPQPN